MVKPDRATLGGVLDYKAKAQNSIRASLLMWERSCIEFYDTLYQVSQISIKQAPNKRVETLKWRDTRSDQIMSLGIHLLLPFRLLKMIFHTNATPWFKGRRIQIGHA